MDKLLVPFLLLALLIGAFLFFFAPADLGKSGGKKPPSQTQPSPPPEVPSIDLESLKGQANRAIDRGEFSEAISLLEDKGAMDPDANALLGYAYSGVKDLSKACGFFEAAIAKKRESTWVYALAFLYDSLGDFTKARPLFDELDKQKLPPDIQAKIAAGLGRANRWCGDTRGALKAFLRSIKANPRDDNSFIELFKIMTADNPGVDWKTVCEAGDRYHSGNYSYLFWKGSFLQGIGQLEGALEAFKTCAGLNPENPAPFYHIYNILRKTSRVEEALAQLGKFLELKAPLPYISFQAAIDAKKEKQYDLAFRFLRQSILYDRTLLGRNDEGTIQAVTAYLGKKGSEEEKRFMDIFTSFMNGEFKSARADMTALMGTMTNPDLKEDGKLLINECDRVIIGERSYQQYLAQMQAMEQQQVGETGSDAPLPGPDTPTDEVKRQALLNPRDARLQYFTAIKLAQMGDIEGSKKFLEETLRANPRISEAYYSLAKIALNEGNAQAAQQHLEKAVQMRPDHSQTRSFLATLYHQNGDEEKATQEARAALNANPSNPEARLILAEVYLKQNLREKALEQIDLGLECERDPAARARFQELQKQVQTE